jgi:hypothetical protein
LYVTARYMRFSEQYMRPGNNVHAVQAVHAKSAYSLPHARYVHAFMHMDDVNARVRPHVRECVPDARFMRHVRYVHEVNTLTAT